MTKNQILIKLFIFSVILLSLSFFFFHCSEAPDKPETAGETAVKPDVFEVLKAEVEAATKLQADIISYQSIVKGTAPADFQKETGALYKPSFNEDPAVPAQCWIETGYGTQNACKYCHTNYLGSIGHGNNFPIGEDQLLFSFPSPGLNEIKWRNITHPGEIMQRLKDHNLDIPQPGDPANLEYVRTDNWTAAYKKARANGDTSWYNASLPDGRFKLFPALNPQDLYPYREQNPTADDIHGYVDTEGFVRDSKGEYTGWRALNFFPYAIFTPFTGSVSGVYIRLPRPFITKDKQIDIDVYKQNLDLLEKVIKNDSPGSQNYFGDASGVNVKMGFYPVGTEFAHPLHYVDLNADGESGKDLDGLPEGVESGYEFPGTRSPRVKEIRYMYKWKEVSLADIGELEHEHEYGKVIGKEWEGWIDNKAGWILAAYIENRAGELRPQTTEELLQCLGCHSSVGNTVDAVWSFQRKLPGIEGWQEMNYGHYRKSDPGRTRLNDYQNENIDMGELEYFYYSVVGADLFGIMPVEIEAVLKEYAMERDLVKTLDLKNPLELIFDDEKLKTTGHEKRKEILIERARIMRDFSVNFAYLYRDEASGEYYIKGTLFYPSEATMHSNIVGYRRIVADQSFNLGKGTFGTTADAIPFTLRSDGKVKDKDGNLIPVGVVITSRPFGSDGIGTTPTFIAEVNEKGEPVDKDGNIVDVEKEPAKIVGHVSAGGLFDTLYNPIIKKKFQPGNKKKEKN